METIGALMASEFLFWVLMWPFALAWELSHKPMIWVFDTVYYALGDMFAVIGKNTARRNMKF